MEKTEIDMIIQKHPKIKRQKKVPKLDEDFILYGLDKNKIFNVKKYNKEMHKILKTSPFKENRDLYKPITK